ncbi:MAG: MobQ family relaxase [bacterium]|nr:MobQ family relaxase [bacterium]
MAIYHFEAKMITRGAGRSVVAAAAYASCSQIYNDYDGLTHNYSRKHGNIYSEIFLPPNAPQEWQDRETLWNAVEAAEKTKDSRLSRELVVSLPVELQLSEWKGILHKFISENCVDKGMCADVNIHDTDGHNPHAHILLTVRPLDDNGKWQSKTQKEYLCKRSDEERGFTADEFKTAKSDGWEKQYQYFVGKKKVYLTPSEAEKYNYERASKYPKSTRYGRQNPIAAEWNSDEQLLKWRKAWEDVVNAALEKNNRDERIDCRSFKERGIKEQPTIYEGASARIMEKRGFVSERCELNRQIKEDNRLLRELKAEVKRLTKLVKNTVSFIANTLETLRNKIVGTQYDINYNENLFAKIQQNSASIDIVLWDYGDTESEIKNKAAELKKLKLEQRNLGSVHIFKHKNLSEQITAAEIDLKKLTKHKSELMHRMGCTTEADIQNLRYRRERNDTVIKNISVQNVELIKQKEADKSKFVEIRNNIAPENADAVQEERYNIREKYRRKLSEQMKDKYGSKYNYDMLKEAEKSINDEFGEKQPSLQRKIRSNRQQAENNDRRRRQKNHEYER